MRPIPGRRELDRSLAVGVAVCRSIRSCTAVACGPATKGALSCQWHWHGAAPDHFMTHLALSEGSGDPAVPDVEWGEHVADDEYRKFP
ncbi:hypothetical protein Strvi_4418 [Streptomyces violaceusniger Tu 4113]|uniref:Uncharacterized protein n=1 Tax=Streptomyces violaceusniger (strain Tu 4113) TaxID=653045 RepID=G2PF50_STRV4|nr:hypothetical protein Strvi_4418 [Streptomyces violaceusniger Tu 4113]